jgi:nucleoside-diphosphate-sugar epimerase
VDQRVRILLAGVTGQLGHGLVTAAHTAGVEIVPVTRKIGRLAATERLARLYPDRTELAAEAITGEVTQPLWGIEPATLRRLAPRIDLVLNVAAETNWAAPDKRLYEVNELAAVHGLAVAEALRDTHPRCGAYVHGSSVFTAGDQLGRVTETPFSAAANRTVYEHTKWLAETRLMAARSRVAVGIARIGGLLGDSVTGATAKRNSLYLLADGSNLLRHTLPFSRRGRVDMLPRDLAAEALLQLAFGVLRLSAREPQIAHVCAGEDAPILTEVLAAARRIDPIGQHRHPTPVPVPSRWLSQACIRLPGFLPLPPKIRIAVEGMRYLALERIFERERLRRFLTAAPPAPTAELIARLAFDLRPAEAAPAQPHRPLARFR